MIRVKKSTKRFPPLNHHSRLILHHFNLSSSAQLHEERMKGEREEIGALYLTIAILFYWLKSQRTKNNNNNNNSPSKANTCPVLKVLKACLGSY